MRQKSGTGKAPAEQVIKDIRQATRKQYWPRRRSASCWKACATRSRYRSTAFSASSRMFDLNGEASTARTKQISAIIAPT